uniref:Uncharacterized protein n=1 Tax=viral metagenome TaxID=1070528 RepID=A0A6C0ERK7_9ZZZZ
MIKLCSPAIIYLIFSSTQIIIDSFKGMYNTAFMKTIVMIMVTFLLNILCEQGLGVVSWIIVFIPFFLMTVIVSILLYIFGLDASTGKINSNKYYNSNTKCGNGITIDNLGNIIIYDPQYNPLLHPVYYNSPNIIIPNPSVNNTVESSIKPTAQTPYPNWETSSPEYQS